MSNFSKNIKTNSDIPQGNLSRSPSSQKVDSSTSIPPLELFPALEQPTPPLSSCKNNLISAIIYSTSGVCAVFYYPIADSGCGILQTVLGWKSTSWNNYFFITSIVTCTYRFATYSLMFKEYTLIPGKNKVAAYTLFLFSLPAATTYLTAGEDGALLENWPELYVNIIGYGDLLIRIIGSLHSCNRFAQEFDNLKTEIHAAKTEKDWKTITRLVTALLIAASYSVFSTNSIYAAIGKIASTFGGEESLGLNIASYFAAVVGAIGTSPAVFYWSYRGVKQLTYGSKTERDKIDNPTDRFTLYAFVFDLLVIPGTIGSSVSKSALKGKVTGAAIAPFGLVPASLNTLTFGVPSVAKMIRNLAPVLSSVSSWVWSGVTYPFRVLITCCSKRVAVKKDLENNSEALWLPLSPPPEF